MSRPRLIYITDRLHLPPGATLPDIIKRNLAAGVRSVYLREKDLGKGCYHELALETQKLCNEWGAELILPADAPYLDEIKNVTLQAGKQTPAIPELKKRFGKDCVIGYSAHSLGEARIAEQNGADYLFLSPIFFTPSKPTLKAIGLEKLHEICQQIEIPVYALGGIHAHQAKDVLTSGAFGIAAISACQSNEFTELCRLLAA